MKCTNCGQDVPDTALVCGYCGHRLKNVDTPSVVISEPTTPKKKKSLLGLWIGLGVLLVIILLVIISSYRRTHPPDLPLPTSNNTENSEIVVPQKTDPPQVETLSTQTKTVEPTPYIDPLLLPSSFTQYTGTPKLELVEHFNDLTDPVWNYSENVSVVADGDEKVLEVPGISGLKGFFCSPEFAPNHGILTKFKVTGPKQLMEFLVFQNQWDTPEYKRFGGAIYQTNQIETTIWEGTDHSLSNQVMMGTLQMKPEKWYGLYIVGNDRGDFTFLVWDLEDPNTFVIQLLEKGEPWSTGLWISCFQVDTGTLYLDDYSIVSFDEIN